MRLHRPLPWRAEHWQNGIKMIRAQIHWHIQLETVDICRNCARESYDTNVNAMNTRACVYLCRWIRWYLPFNAFTTNPHQWEMSENRTHSQSKRLSSLFVFVWRYGLWASAVDLLLLLVYSMNVVKAMELFYDEIRMRRSVCVYAAEGEKNRNNWRCAQSMDILLSPRRTITSKFQLVHTDFPCANTCKTLSVHSLTHRHGNGMKGIEVAVCVCMRVVFTLACIHKDYDSSRWQNAHVCVCACVCVVFSPKGYSQTAAIFTTLVRG